MTIAASKVFINEQLLREVENTKKTSTSLLKQVSALYYLLRQGIAICNNHAGGSNLSFMFEKVFDESSCVKEGKYQSPECINEMIEIVRHKVLRSFISEVQ